MNNLKSLLIKLEINHHREKEKQIDSKIKKAIAELIKKEKTNQPLNKTNEATITILNLLKDHIEKEINKYTSIFKIKDLINKSVLEDKRSEDVKTDEVIELIKEAIQKKYADIVLDEGKQQIEYKSMLEKGYEHIGS